jgi:hypothetical protein
MISFFDDETPSLMLLFRRPTSKYCIILVLRDRKRKVLGAPKKEMMVWWSTPGRTYVVSARSIETSPWKLVRFQVCQGSSFIHLHTHINSQIENMT